MLLLITTTGTSIVIATIGLIEIISLCTMYVKYGSKNDILVS